MTMINYNRFVSATSPLALDINRCISLIPQDIKDLVTEIRLRVNKPIKICTGKNHMFLLKDGNLSDEATNDKCFIANQRHIVDTYQKICGYSVYSHQKELSGGYITIKGGHRCGLCGTAITDTKGICGMRDITSINIRVSREFKDSSLEIFNRLTPFESGLLIIGPPASGKTTVLRDLARRISINNKNVSIIDERGEIAGAWNGIMINDIGECDVLNGYSKSKGIMNAIRSMSPDVIICDEIGSVDECSAIEEAINSGVTIIASVHCDSIEGLYQKPQGKRLIATGAFKHIVLLKGKDSPGKLKDIFLIKGDRINV